MPGGPFGAYNLGNTRVQEVGARSRACSGIVQAEMPVALFVGSGLCTFMVMLVSMISSH